MEKYEMASDNIDVSALLQQLEELKQKKARNIKKLKRKLGKTVGLNQPCTDNEGSVNDIEKISYNHKASVSSETRSILGELNYKDKAVGSTRSVDNELKSSNKAAISTINCETEISNNEVGDARQNVIESTYVCANSDQEPLVCRKRPAAEFQHDDTAIGNFKLNKKTKLSYSKSSEGSVNVTSCDKNVIPTFEDDCKLLKEPEASVPDKHDRDVQEFVDCNIKFDDNHLPTFNSEDYLICDDIKLQKTKINVQESINCESNKIILNGVGFKENASIQKETGSHMMASDLNQSTPENLICQNEEIKQNIKSDEVYYLNLNSCKNYILPVQSNIEENLNSNVLEIADTEVLVCPLSNSAVIDCNVIEIANTEVLLPPQSSPKVISCDKLMDSPRRVDEHKAHNSIIANWNENDTINEIAETRQISVDFSVEVASFEEVQTEISHSHVAGSSPVNEKNSPLNCTFSQEENDSTDIINREDIDKLFWESSESDGNEFDNMSPHSPVSDIEVTSPHPKSRLSADGDNGDDTNVFTNNVKDLVTDSDVLMVPETELFDFASYSNTEIGDVAHNISIKADNTTYFNKYSSAKNLNVLKPEVKLESSSNEGASFHNSSKDIDLPIVDESGLNSGKENGVNKPSSQIEFDSDSLATQDFLKLVDFQQMPFSSDSSKSNEQSEDKNTTIQDSRMKFQCCFQSDISEEVIQLKLCYFNNSLYLFIQHKTWIQVWRQETNCDWVKIFAHQVDDLHLKEVCLSQSDNYLVLVLLLCSKQNHHCLQFLVFERESRLIKLMENTHWFENSGTEEKIYICGLDDLKFASAQGGDIFKVYSHSLSGLEESPRLLTISLGSTADCLHSLCRIDKLPNALLGMSKSMLYVWHTLEARLVTSIRFQIEDSVDIENCIWTTIENGLVFMMATYKVEESPNACQLIAANLATGFCEVVLTYTLQPAKEGRSVSPRKMALTYCEPFIAATTEEGAFVWSIDEEYCCASLLSLDYSSIAIVPTQNNSFLIFVGCTGGCVNCFELKYN